MMRLMRLDDGDEVAVDVEEEDGEDDVDEDDEARYAQ